MKLFLFLHTYSFYSLVPDGFFSFQNRHKILNPQNYHFKNLLLLLYDKKDNAPIMHMEVMDT